MTRVEEISNESLEYMMTSCIHDEIYDVDVRNAFEEGAKWADRHSKHKWINVEDDLPCNHKGLITKDGITTMPVPTISYDGLLELHNMVKVMSSKGSDRWIWEEGISPQYWFNLPGLK